MADTSGVDEYQYAIGTSPGKTDKIYWNSVGTSTSTSANLSANPLIDRQKYYASVRVKNNDGYFSVVGVSDGIEYFSGDFANDGIVNVSDLTIFVSYWLETNCSHNSNCYGVDSEPDGDVDFSDFSVFFSNWMQGVD